MRVLLQDLAIGIGNQSMQIIAQCPRCGNSWLLDAGAADRRVKCRKCRRLFRVPKLGEVPKAIKVIKHARGTIYVDEAGRTYG
jgi:transposase-like protein